MDALCPICYMQRSLNNLNERLTGTWLCFKHNAACQLSCLPWLIAQSKVVVMFGNAAALTQLYLYVLSSS